MRIFVGTATATRGGAMGAPRRSVKARPADEWKGRLREDVLERVRTNRVAILSRARGEGASGASLRDEVDIELRQILSEALGRASRGGFASISIPPAGSNPRACTTQSAAADAPGDPGDPGYSRDRGLADSRLPRAPPRASRDSDDDGMWDDGDVPLPPPRARRSLTTWGEAAGTGALSGVEYDELMAAMHLSVEEELRAEEAAALARELDRVESEEALNLDAALENLANWELDSAASGADDPAVLCPVCRARRLLQTSGTIFCGCGRFRLSRRDGASDGTEGRAHAESFGLDHLRRRLEDAYDAHAKEGCGNGNLGFAVRDAFGAEVLYAECPRCRFLEAVM